MTTTLRPTGPLTETPDGVRNRAYQVCVNGRPVGAVELGTDPAFGPTAGVVRGLRIDEPDRRRGRGTVAALAAEEVLRGWGCRQALASTPADADVAGRLLRALGYTERSVNMVETLPPAAPALPPGVRERAMSPGEFEEWSASVDDRFAANWTSRGMTCEQARAKARTSRLQNLPDGLATPGVSFRVLDVARSAVGRVWVARQEITPGTPGGYVYEVEVGEESRGRGYGRMLMGVAERVALDWGATALGLHVFADNAPAVGLYTSLGYRVTARHFAKQLL